MAQIFVGKRTLVTDVYRLKSQKQFVNTLEDNIRFRGAMTKLISDYSKVEISNKVKDILRMYHSSSWNSEPYHQNQNPAEGRYCTLKSWTNTIMNRSDAPADCWLLCMIHDSYFLSHLSCEALAGNVPLGMLYGVSPDISESASFSYTLSNNQCFMPPTTYLTPLLVRKELHDGLTLENMLVMPSPTNSLMMPPRKPSTDLLSDPQILPIPTGVLYQMEGRASRPPNQLSLSGLGKMIVNLLPNPWQNTTLMILLAGPSYSQRMNKEKGLGPL